VPLIDTVEHAAATPDHPQPYRELGLKDDEYQRIREILGRRPTDAELAMYSVMWSEHCSYKSSKVHLRYFGETTTDEMRSGMLAGIGENAGVVDIGDGWAVTFKVESHNHPSYVEPYQGAATGVGGIVRDIMAMGARPVAVMDQLRFGAADAPDTRRVLDGVVRGISGYGNSLGLPNIGGETVFDASYAGNPLVNAMCVGVLRKEDLHLAFASGTGNKIILFGARTGLDGIGGVSVLASDTFSGEESGTGRKKLPSVQVGDPFFLDQAQQGFRVEPRHHHDVRPDIHRDVGMGVGGGVIDGPDHGSDDLLRAVHPVGIAVGAQEHGRGGLGLFVARHPALDPLGPPRGA
jgi:phosphoribosylformylglycinamidine synthase